MMLGKNPMIKTAKTTTTKSQMRDEEMETVGKMHENASSIFAHNKHKLSDGKV